MVIKASKLLTHTNPAKIIAYVNDAVKIIDAISDVLKISKESINIKREKRCKKWRF